MKNGREAIYLLLKSNNIAYEVTEHNPVFNMEELSTIELPYPEWEAKKSISKR